MILHNDDAPVMDSKFRIIHRGYVHFSCYIQMIYPNDRIILLKQNKTTGAFINRKNNNVACQIFFSLHTDVSCNHYERNSIKMDESIKEEQFSSSHNNSIDDIEMISLTDENLADLLITKYDYLDSCIANEKFDTQLCSNLVLLLKFILENGPHLDDDINHREQMNMFFTLFRNILRNHLKYLPDSINLLILRLIEIRASKWKIKSNIEEYYMKKVNKLQSNNNNNQNMFKTNNNRSNYHEKSSNIRMSKSYNDVINANNNDGSPPKNSKPLKMNTKGIYKDEVSIKNSDSGKVMGIKGRRIHMIEEMSDTIISFQKVSPTAKERLVLISGYNRENIEKAKNLIDVTIRQNISPIPIESNDVSNFNLTMSSIKTSVADPIENGTNFFNCSSSSNETNIEKNLMTFVNLRILLILV
uniref:Eukaryotic translation initiation factor 4E-binding protein Mextli-like n=1 Tax=Dermatophagoides pteronyssinus TaxID=6956 RepID=A0A6P6XZJ4_DERPT|nr:eukaryotic translation initiation factor 4E-binding protein Mextli-like [Dermatophagoides pteronyssinus]